MGYFTFVLMGYRDEPADLMLLMYEIALHRQYLRFLEEPKAD